MTVIRSKWYQKRIAFFLALVMSFLLLPAPVWAWEKIDTEQEVSLKIAYRDGDTTLRDVEFSLYRVAEVADVLKFRLVEPFQKYGDHVTLKDLDAEGWKQAALTLKGYVLRDDLPATARKETNTSGEAVFEGLETGLYLVIGERTKVGHYKYTAEPFLLCLPGLNQKDQNWEYDLDVNVKFDRDRVGGGGSGEETEKNWKVLKVWKDAEYRKERPDKVEMQLLRDGQVYETVTLKEDNNWRYTWNDLSDAYEWMIVEKEIENYTAAVNEDGTTFVVTNTREDKEQPDEDSPDGESIEEDEPGLVLGATDEGQKLPATGALWWPVPILSCVGLILVLSGCFWKRRHEDEE